MRWDWRYTGNRLHPTQKPVEALQPLIGTYSRPGDVVLDPFAGSGSTAVAARQLGRRPIGIELDWGHCCVANERLVEEG
ncbi:MAG: DNA methyltransferase [Dehalococcoidia bacterium]|nr:DNA methyltransferase [Dehalococcoidia bacterium]